MPEIPAELAEYVARLMPEDLERIGGAMEDLKRQGLVPKPRAKP